MTHPAILQTHARAPIDAVLAAPETSVLAVIAGVEGPSYRPLGAMMAIGPDDGRTGTLSSGCIEADIVIHAREARRIGRPKMLRYGRGSPFADIQLPCGGGLDILLLPQLDKAVLSDLARRHAARVPVSLTIDVTSGEMELGGALATACGGGLLTVGFQPEIKLLIFGKGPEAATFASLVHSAGYPSTLLSPDEETRAAALECGCATKGLTMQSYPDGLAADDRTAITLFFHDHEWEPPILLGALQTPAFYVGAQGSRKARDARHLTLEAMGVSQEALARLRGPVGLIPSARDAGTLAVSVLAEVLATAMAEDP